MTHTLTRRTALSGIALIGAAPATAALPMPRIGENAAFDAKIVEWRRLQASASTFHATIYQPLQEALTKARKTWEAACEQVPHYTTACTYETLGGTHRSLSTSELMDIAVAKSAVAKPFDDEPYMAAANELWTALQERGAKMQALRGQSRLEALEARAGELANQDDENFDAAHKAFRAAIAHPASSLSVLARKVALIEEVEPDNEVDPYWEDLARDIKSLAGEA